MQANPLTKIIVVDDEPDIRKALARILTLEGYQATPVSSGQEALELLQTESYHLMLLDMQMPGMSGVEVMAQVREKHPQVAIIVLTGNATLETAIESAKTEMVLNYLLKPANNNELLNAVRQALEKQQEKLNQTHFLSAAAQMVNAFQQIQHTNPPTAPIQPIPRVSAPAAEDETRYIRAYPLTLDVERRMVTSQLVETQAIELTEGEFTILEVLISSPDKVFSCQELVREALGYDEPDKFAAESLVRPYISRLRGKLEANPKKPHYICTVRQRGYMFPRLTP